MSLQLRNPHSVLAALRTRPRDVIEIRLQAHKPSGAWEDVVRIAGENRVPVRFGVGRHDAGQSRRNDPTKESGRAGAAAATVKERADVGLEELFASVQQTPSPRGVWLALDFLQDPHNVGAVFRSAAFFGVRGIVLTRSRSASVNATVYDVASGAVEYVPFALEANLSSAIQHAKQSGLWVLGTSEHAADEIWNIDRDRAWLLVLGNEETGLRRSTLAECDVVCRLPPRGHVTSLNVSVAAGVFLSQLTRDSE